MGFEQRNNKSMDEKEVKESTAPFSTYEYIYPGEIAHIFESDEYKRSRAIPSKEENPITLYVYCSNFIYDVYGEVGEKRKEGAEEDDDSFYYCVPRKVSVEWYGIRSSKGIHRLYSPIGDVTKVIFSDAIDTYKKNPNYVVVSRGGGPNTISTKCIKNGRVNTMIIAEKKELIPLSIKYVFPSMTDKISDNISDKISDPTPPASLTTPPDGPVV